MYNSKDEHLGKLNLNIIKLRSYELAIANTKTYSVYAIPTYMYVEVPKVIVYQNCVVQEIVQVSPQESTLDSEYYSRSENGSWIDIQFNALDTCSGHHTYKVVFMNTDTNAEYIYFFSYNTNTNKPEKAYKYMKD